MDEINALREQNQRLTGLLLQAKTMLIEVIDSHLEVRGYFPCEIDPVREFLYYYTQATGLPGLSDELTAEVEQRLKGQADG